SSESILLPHIIAKKLGKSRGQCHFLRSIYAPSGTAFSPQASQCFLITAISTIAMSIQAEWFDEYSGRMVYR
ncbi:MAG: hypothetical protein AAFN12_16800, partial [Cyanobacteria bacterium J06560_2]